MNLLTLWQPDKPGSPRDKACHHSFSHIESPINREGLTQLQLSASWLLYKQCDYADIIALWLYETIRA